MAGGAGARILVRLARRWANSGVQFYEAVSVLPVFILLGHWLEMRARAGANDVIRKLMDLAPPMASVVRDGRELSIPTAQVLADDVVVVRPGDKIPVDGVVAAGAADPTAVCKFLTKENTCSSTF